MSLSLSVDNPEHAAFLAKNSIGVLATANSQGQPRATVIYYIVDPSLNLYFITKSKTNKAKNIEQNEKVSLAVYDASTQTTAQIIGKAEKLDDESRFEDIFARVQAVADKTSASPVPPISKLVAGPYEVYCITPDSIQIANYSTSKPGAPETIFDSVDIS